MRIFRKKYPVVTKTIFNQIEMLCRALEVLTGEHVFLVQHDFNTGRGKVCIGDQDKEIMVRLLREDMIELDIDNVLWKARLLGSENRIGVWSHNKPIVKRDGKDSFIMWWVGRSDTDRSLEPMFSYSEMYRSIRMGLSVKRVYEETEA